MKAIVYFFFLVSLQSAFGQARSDSTTVFIGTQGHYGFILAHTRSIAEVATSNPFGWQVDISRIRNTQSSWNTCNCISQNGISFFYVDFNNSEVLGRSANLVLFAEPQILYGKIGLGVRAGIGLSYLNRIYHSDNNPQNLFVSNPFSAILLLQLNSRIRVSDYWSVRVATSYNHISNGGTKQPNKGINFPTLSVGAEYGLNPFPLKSRTKNRLADRTLHYYGGLSYNTRNIDESGFTDRKRKKVVGLQTGFYKPFSNMHAAGLGVEGTYDGALKELNTQTTESYDHRVLSGLVRHHLLFGKFDFSQALGIYLYKNYPTPHNVFQRYAIDYQVFQHFRLGVSLKAHLHTAEQMDIRFLVVF